MNIVKIKTENGRERYYVADSNGLPVESILKFVKFKDNLNYSRNTLKSYCQSLKLYFEFLEYKKIDFKVVEIDNLADFVSWLQFDKTNGNIILFKQKRCEKTINSIVDTVLMFYDYLLRHDEYSNVISLKVQKLIRNTNDFKGFLYGIANKKTLITSNILKLRVPKEVCKILTKPQISTLINKCNNIRDKFLLTLLYETGIRIGEALSLWIEDFDICNMKLCIVDRGQLENNAEIKTVASPRKIDISKNLTDIFVEYINALHVSEVNTNHIFIKLTGKNKYKAMSYTDVDNLFRTLKQLTNIYVTPHMFRHTSLTALRMAGWKIELLKIRAGHKNIYTTLNTYVHPTLEEITEEFDKVKDILILPENGGV